MAAEDAEHPDALVGADGRALAVDGVLCPRDGGREADAVLRTLHVVVHRLGHGDDVHAGIVQRAAVAQGVVAADGDEVIQAHGLDVLHHQRSEVIAVLIELHRLGTLGVEVRRQRRLLHLARVGARAVQPGAAGAVDGAGVVDVQRYHVAFVEHAPGLLVGQPFPAAPDADDLEAELMGPVRHPLDDAVQAGDVAAPRQDADA